MKISGDLYAFLWLDPTTNNCNAYFINGEKKILVDPGHHHLFGHVKDGLSRLSLAPSDMDLVILTHCHPDHMEGVKTFFDSSTLIGVHQAEMAFMNEVAPHYAQVLGDQEFRPDILLQEGNMHVGDLFFDVIHTPGHSPGSICLYWPDKKTLFSGDLIFHQGVGRTDLPGGNSETLKQSIKKISRLEVDLLLPGHGDIVSGPDLVTSNFAAIESLWFAYL